MPLGSKRPLFSPTAAVTAFASTRSPGIYKQDYLHELFRRYADVDDAPSAPALPAWSHNTSAEDLHQTVRRSNATMPRDEEPGDSNGGESFTASTSSAKFMDGQIAGIVFEPDANKRQLLQSKVRDMCNYRGFAIV